MVSQAAKQRPDQFDRHSANYGDHFHAKRGGVVPGHEEAQAEHRLPHHFDDDENAEQDHAEHASAPTPRRRRKRKHTELKASGHRSKARADRKSRGHAEHHTTVMIHHSTKAPHLAGGGSVAIPAMIASGVLDTIGHALKHHHDEREREHEHEDDEDDDD